jgi:hypothetical protein
MLERRRLADETRSWRRRMLVQIRQRIKLAAA